MKILYAVQATGNGHISRAMELFPYLQQYGQVDLMLSGSNSSLCLDAPVKYRSEGLSLFYNCNGGLDYLQLMKKMQVFRIQQQVRELPVEKYDLILNDFDYVTAAACARKKIPSFQFGHQASFKSPKTPRPGRKNFVGEWILKNYAPATNYIGFHFDRYDDFIFTPVIKKEIREAEPIARNYITVYLPSYCDPQLEEVFSRFPDVHFEIFSKDSPYIRQSGNITFLPVQKDLFNKSLVYCTGIITGGGFETPAEALYLGKKLMCVPIRSHYEQLCNTTALERMGVMCIQKIGYGFRQQFENWMHQPPLKINYPDSIPLALEHLFSLHEETQNQRAMSYEY